MPGRARDYRSSRVPPRWRRRTHDAIPRCERFVARRYVSSDSISTIHIRTATHLPTAGPPVSYARTLPAPARSGVASPAHPLPPLPRLLRLQSTPELASVGPSLPLQPLINEKSIERCGFRYKVSSRQIPCRSGHGTGARDAVLPETDMTSAGSIGVTGEHITTLTGQSSNIRIDRLRRNVIAWCGSCRPLLRVLAEPSSCLPVRQHPGTDLGFQHLADFGARKVIPDFNLLGRFDAPESLLHEGR